MANTELATRGWKDRGKESTGLIYRGRNIEDYIDEIQKYFCRQLCLIEIKFHKLENYRRYGGIVKAFCFTFVWLRCIGIDCGI